MPSEGGQYRIKNGKRELVHRTKPAPVNTEEKSKPNAVQSAGKPAKPAAKQEGSNNGSE